MPRPTATAQVTGEGRGPGAQAAPAQRGPHLYCVTAGLALAEQWKVTTLSSSTGCGSTDRLTSGGSAGRRESLVDRRAVAMVLGKNEAGRPPQ